MKVTGACLCGAVSFSGEIAEDKVMICHCADCQVLSSTAFRVGAMAPKELLQLTGETREYRREACVGARNQVFCPQCATVIYSYTPDSDEPHMSLSVGTLHQRAKLPPRFQLWRSVALPWVNNLADLPEISGQDLLRTN